MADKELNQEELTQEELLVLANDGNKVIEWTHTSPAKIAEGIKRVRQTKFLKAFEQCGTLTEACKIAGINRMTHRRWVEVDPWFRDHFKDSMQAYRDSIETEVHNRAIKGVEVPIVGKVQTPLGPEDQIIGYKTVKSDLLLMFQAKRHIMEYRDKYDPPKEDDKPVDGSQSLMARITVRLDMMGTRQEAGVSLPAASGMEVIDVSPEQRLLNAAEMNAAAESESE